MTDPTAVAATAAPEARHDGDVPFHEGELRLQEVFNEQVRAKRISFSVRYPQSFAGQERGMIGSRRAGSGTNSGWWV